MVLIQFYSWLSLSYPKLSFLLNKIKYVCILILLCIKWIFWHVFLPLTTPHLPFPPLCLRRETRRKADLEQNNPFPLQWRWNKAGIPWWYRQQAGIRESGCNIDQALKTGIPSVEQTLGPTPGEKTMAPLTGKWGSGEPYGAFQIQHWMPGRGLSRRWDPGAMAYSFQPTPTLSVSELLPFPNLTITKTPLRWDHQSPNLSPLHNCLYSICLTKTHPTNTWGCPPSCLACECLKWTTPTSRALSKGISHSGRRGNEAEGNPQQTP